MTDDLIGSCRGAGCTVDWLFEPLSPALLARAASEAGADLAQRRAYRPVERMEGWSRLWTSCQECGTTDRPHAAHGYCSACHKRRLRAEKRGAVA